MCYVCHGLVSVRSALEPNPCSCFVPSELARDGEITPARGRGSRGGRGRAAGPARATAIADPASAGVVAGTAGHVAGTVPAGVAAGIAAVDSGAGGGGGEKGIRKPGRAKIVIKPIVNDHQRQTTFTKRKNGLMKKVEELAVLCGVEMCLICYGASRGTDKQNNNQNNSLFWGKPSDEDVIRRYKAIPKEEQDKRKMDNTSMLESLVKKHASELRQLRETNYKMIEDKGCYQRGYEVLSQCNVAQLRSLMDEVKQKRDMVHARLEQIHREEQASRARASGGGCLGQMPFEAGRGHCLQAALDTARGCADGHGAVPVMEWTGANSALASSMHQNYPRMPQGLTLSKLRQQQQQQQQQVFPLSASSSGMQQQQRRRLAPQSYWWENQGVPPPNLMLYHQIQHQNLLFTLRLNQHQQQQLHAKQEHRQHQQQQQYRQQQLRANQQEDLQQQQQKQHQLRANQQEELQEQPSLKRGRQEQLQYQPSLKRGSQEELQYQPSLKRGSEEELQYQPSVKRGLQDELQYQPSLKRGSQEELQYQPGLPSLMRGSQEQLQYQPGLKRQQQMQHLEQESKQLAQPDPQPNVDSSAEPEPPDEWASFDDPNSEFEWLNRDQLPLTSF